jgi:hypothetical protein
MHTTRSAWVRIERAVLFGVSGAALAAIVLHIAFKVLNLNLAEYDEGPMLAIAVRWLTGKPDASWLTGLPFTLNPYGPVYPLILKTLLGAFPSAPPLLLGRLISVAAGCVTGLLIFFVVRKEERNSVAAWLALTAFLTAPLVYQWWWFARVDALAALATVTAYVVAPAKRGPLLSALCLVVGSLVKQNVAFHAVPLAVWFVVSETPSHQRVRQFVAYGTAIGLAAWLGVFAAYPGYFFRTAVLFHAEKTLRPWRAFELAYSFLPTAYMFAAIAAAARLCLTRPLLRSLANRYWLGFTFSLLLDTALLLKEGSQTIYLLPASVFGAVLIGLAATELLGLTRRTAPVVLAMTSVVVAFPAFMELRAFDWMPPRPTRQTLVTASLRAAGNPTAVLCDGEAMPFVLGAGAMPVVSDPFALTVLATSGRLDLRPLQARVREGSIDYVLLAHTIEWHKSVAGTPIEFWPRPLLDDLDAHYEMGDALPGLYVYRPRDAVDKVRGSR